MNTRVDSRQTVRVVASVDARPVEAQRRDSPVAVVVGMCVHGLATVRALNSHGVKVYALEQNEALPGTATSSVAGWFKGAIYGDELIETLLRLAVTQKWSSRPVLFLMNDRMVRGVASAWEALSAHYRLSWSGCRDEVVRLQSKDRIPEVCRANGIRFPATRVLANIEDCASVESATPYPVIVKPAVPMGEFKAIIVERPSDLAVLVQKYVKSLPFVVQQWIPGGPTALKFCNLYLVDGRVVARFEGRKGYAGPDGLGQGTVMEPWPDDRVYEAATRFISGLNLTGPVAVEFKEDTSGRLWLIEPNVGRTEYCVDVCIANGINFPFIEYQHAIGEELIQAVSHNSRIWFDTDRDKMAWFRFAASNPLNWRVLRPVFPYLRMNDFKPFVRSSARYLSSKFGRGVQGSELVANERRIV